jgi:hypothetical protein
MMFIILRLLLFLSGFLFLFRAKVLVIIIRLHHVL